MMDAHRQDVGQHEFEVLANDFNEAIDQLFFGTQTAERLKGLSARVVADATRLKTNRGISVPSIGFFGPKNAGKSFLLRILLRSDAIRHEIKTGFGASGRTERLMWLGETPPANLDPHLEVYIHIDPTKDTLIERPAVLVDIPGFTDPNTRTTARHALTSCQLKVLVIDASDVEREDAVNYGEGFDGTYILPVINRIPGDPDGFDAAASLRRALLSNIEQWAPRANCLKPVLIPHLKHEDVSWTTPQLAEHLATATTNALGELQDVPAKASTQVALRMHRFHAEIRRQLPQFSQTVEDITADLEQAMSEMSDVAKDLLGDDKIAELSVRLWMRARIVDNTASIFFPYRSVLRLLTLTTGAWESATMGLSGSLPSLALAAVQSVRNARKYKHWSSEIETGLQRRLEQAASAAATPVVARLYREIDRHTGSTTSSEHTADCSPAVEVHGVSELQEESRRLFDQSIRQATPQRAVLTMVASIASGAFLALIAGPMMALYGKYASVASNVFQLQSQAFADFPVIEVGVLATALILSLIPVFVIAGLLLSFSTSDRRVRESVAQLRESHKAMVTEFIKSGRLRIRTENRKIEAAQWLGRFLRRDD